jgi:heat shock protein HtpX
MSISTYTKWQRRDTGLTARISISFAILALLYTVFLSVLVYVGLDFISITIIASIMIVAQWYFSDRLVLLVSGAKKVSREQFPELHDMVERIIARNNLPKPQIAVINTKMPNAFATGRSPKSSVVAVTTGLIDLLDREELEGVLAHELTHIRNRDVLVLTLASLFSTVAWYLMQFGFYGGGMGYGYGGGDDDRSNSAGAMIIIIVWLCLLGFLAFSLFVLFHVTENLQQIEELHR